MSMCGALYDSLLIWVRMRSTTGSHVLLSRSSEGSKDVHHFDGKLHCSSGHI